VIKIAPNNIIRRVIPPTILRTIPFFIIFDIFWKMKWTNQGIVRDLLLSYFVCVHKNEIEERISTWLKCRKTFQKKPHTSSGFCKVKTKNEMN
jgi:hypothetical protein